MAEIEDIITKIETETLADLTSIKEKIKTIPLDKKITLVNYLQDVNDKLYNDYGATDGILDLQVFINELRRDYDITDPKEVINTDDGMDFVQ